MIIMLFDYSKLELAPAIRAGHHNQREGPWQVMTIAVIPKSIEICLVSKKLNQKHK